MEDLLLYAVLNSQTSLALEVAKRVDPSYLDNVYAPAEELGLTPVLTYLLKRGVVPPARPWEREPWGRSDVVAGVLVWFASAVVALAVGYTFS